MDICILVKSNSGLPNIKGYTLESYTDMASRWEPLINKALDESEDGYDSRKFQQLFKQALREFGQLMHGKDINANVQFVQDWMSDNDYDWMEEYIPSEGLKNAISKKYQATVADILPQYDESVPEDTMSSMPAKFLEDKFGNNANLKNALKQEVSHKFISTFIIDRENNRLILNATDANISARRHKQELFDIVCDYLGTPRINLFTAEGNYTKALDSEDFKNAMRKIKSFDIWEQMDIEQAANDHNQDKYNAYKAWFTLKNYDNFLNLLLGNAVTVHPEARGHLANGNVYTFSDKHGANITSWRTDDNTVLSQVIASLAQSLIITTPALRYGSLDPTGHYLKFEDFYRMITKLKDLVILNNAKLSSPIRNVFFDNIKNDPELLNEFGYKSLREIINGIRLNPQKNTQIALRLLTSDEGLLKELGFEPDDRDKLYSIYKGIYSISDSGSINYIQNQVGPDGKKLYSHNSQDYYSLISQVADTLFSVGFLQYNETDGVVTVRTLNDQGADNTRRAIEQSIAQMNSKKIIHDDFKTRHMDPYNARPKMDKEGHIKGIELKIGSLQIELTDLGRKVKFSKYELVDGKLSKYPKTLGVQEFKTAMNPNSTDFLEMINFLDHQLGLNLSRNPLMLDALDKEFPNTYSLMELAKLASVVLMNKYVSNTRLANKKGYLDIMIGAMGAFGVNKNDEYLPGYNYDLNEINLIPDVFIPTLDNIAKAKTRVTGEAQSTQVRTADGDMLSQLTLSRLIGNIVSQWEEIRKADGAASEFSLIQPGMYLGHYASKELKSILGNKAETKFTVAELAQGAFLYDFVQGLMPTQTKSGKELYGNGVVGLYPSVNSDKGTIGRIVLNLGMKCERFGKSYKDLTIDEIIQLTGEELGRAYEKSYNTILKDYADLTQWLAPLGINVIINPNNNFRELNEYAELQGTKPQKLLFEWTRIYNNAHPTKPIRLIENIHYTKGAGGIQFNNTYRALRSRYGNPKEMKRFMDYKRTELVSALLSEGAEFNLFQEGNTLRDTPKKWLQKNYAEWVGVNDVDPQGNTIRKVDNGRMVIAKLVHNGNTYNITSKQDLVNFASIAKVSADTLINDPHEMLKYGLQVHPLLDKYNAFDYLFTQEFMMSGVGSHTAHPSKTKIKPVPIIWGHPGIGKTHSQNGVFGNEFLDWDTEFNHLRDAWIESQSGIFKMVNGEQNPAFKAVRNKYLINWRNHPEFQEFVKTSWKNIKAKAQSQNKMLLASPAMLLELFPKDFDLVINMTDEDFIERGKARGDADPASWKLGINAVVNNYTQYNAKDKVLMINKGEYLEDLLSNGKLQKFQDRILDNEVQEEAARFLAQHKRNVSYTAQMQEFHLGQLTGIPTMYNMAMMEDVPANTYTITGDTNVNDSYDGATFVNPYVVHWENNSLNSASAGIDKKQFVHFYDEITGTGGIVKTAGFGVTNDRMRRYKFYRTMNKNMTRRNWFNEDGTQHIMQGKGILQDFEGRDVDYGIIYYKKGNKYFAREINSYLGQNKYQVTDREVDVYGAYVNNESDVKELEVNSNYDMWEMFGGMRSMEVNKGKLEYSESSILNVAKAASNYGIMRPGHTRALTQDDVYQPMKHSDIHYMPTKGAVKQGACNINPWSSFFNETQVNFMRVKMTQAGIQLDKEHHANDSVLSLMTQVISAACSRGLMPQTSSKVYEALYELTKVGTKNFRDELGNLHLGVNGDLEQFSAAVTDVIMKTILTSTSSDGDMMQSIARQITAIMDKNGVYKFDKDSLKEYDKYIPYSSPEIFRKVVTSLTTAMTKKGIKTKMPGVLSVLCPAHDIVKFYKVPVNNEGKAIAEGEVPTTYRRVTLEQMEDLYGIEDDEQLMLKLDEFQANEPHFTDLNDPEHGVEIGYKYLINEPIINKVTGLQEVINGVPQVNQYVVHIVRPNTLVGDGDYDLGSDTEWKANTRLDYQGKSIPSYIVGYTDLKKKLKNSGATIQEWARDGQDLHSYQVKFSDGVTNFQLGDLDIVQDYFTLKSMDKTATRTKEQAQRDFMLNLVYNVYGKGVEFQERIRRDLTVNRTTKPTPKDMYQFALIDAFINNLNGNPNYELVILQALINVKNTWNTALVDPRYYKTKRDYESAEARTKEEIMLRVEQQIYDYLHKMGIGFMNRTMQQTLNAISPTSKDDVVVKIDGQERKIDRNSIKIQSFGIIMPKVFKENFGLDTFDSVKDVLDDPDFFTKKIVQKFATKVNSYPVDEEGSAYYNNFDLELKRNDGKHIYIRLSTSERGDISLKSRSSSEVCNLTNKINWFKQIDPDGKVYRIDSNHQIMYEMFSEDDEIYLDDDGNEIIVPSSKASEYFEDEDGNRYEKGSVMWNRNGYTVKRTGKKVTLKTNNPTLFYLNNLSYATVNISQYSPDRVFIDILDQMRRSTNKQANRYYDRVTKYDTVEKRRDVVKKFNDYTGAFGDGETKNIQQERIRELGREIYTSFLRSKDLVAARIPSQNQLSFMAMEVEAFDNPDINTAYVSIFQFYLQGSDLDIDAVSLQVFDIDESGLFVGHSPYYSLTSSDMRKASEDLPFPTGHRINIDQAMDVESCNISNIQTKYPGFIAPEGTLKLNIDKDGNVHLKPNIQNILDIQAFADIINTANDEGIFMMYEENITEGDILKFNTLFSVQLDKKQLIQLSEELKRIIDDHNLFVKNLDGKTQEKLIKNYAITQLYNIIIDPINLLESWSSVDTVTGPVKKLASQSPKATVQNMFSPGNFMNKFLSLSENMVGKDGIAICATGLKSFFGFTSMYQTILNSPLLTALEKDALLHPVTIGGKTYMGLANAFSPEFKSVYEYMDADNSELFTDQMLNFLLDLLWAPDAANDMSALLGLSADNAKELVLAKINAGTATLGMYLYGMAIGVPMTTLYEIINSPLGRRLTELTKGDYFNGDVGTRNIIGALLYLKTEPSLRAFNHFDSDKKVDAPGVALVKEINKTFDLGKSHRPILDMCRGEFGRKTTVTSPDINVIKQTLEGLRDKVKPHMNGLSADEKVKYIAQYNRAIDAIQQFIDDRQLLFGPNSNLYTIYGYSKIYDNLEVLATGAEEMKTCGKILHLNQEIYTTPDKLIDLVNTVETLIDKRQKQIDKQERRAPQLKQKREKSSDDTYVDLERFMTDEDYAERKIAQYDQVAQSFNVLRLIKTAPNYRGYVESMLTAHKGLILKSAKQEVILDTAYTFINDFNVVDPNLQAKVIKNAENAVDMYIREQWMLKEKLAFDIPAATEAKPTYVYIDSLKQPRINYAKRTINLGTPLGDANFKLWIERTVIPDLKLKYPDNMFIRDLEPIISGTSDLGAKTINYGLRINMMPKKDDEYAVDLFNQYKEAFNSLTTADPYTSKFRVQDLLYLYSLLSYRGKQGPRSLHGIFLDYTGGYVDSYRRFISEVDNDVNARLAIKDYITDAMLAPIANPARGGSDLIKYFDKNSEIPYLLELPSKNDEDGEYEQMDGNPDGSPEEQLHFGEYLPTEQQFDDANYSMFGTAEKINPAELGITETRDIAELDPRFTGMNFKLTAIGDPKTRNIVSYVMDSIDLGDPKLNTKVKEALDHFIPTVVTKVGSKVVPVPEVDVIYRLIEDIKNNCE